MTTVEKELMKRSEWKVGECKLHEEFTGFGKYDREELYSIYRLVDKNSPDEYSNQEIIFKCMPGKAFCQKIADFLNEHDVQYRESAQSVAIFLIETEIGKRGEQKRRKSEKQKQVTDSHVIPFRQV